MGWGHLPQLLPGGNPWAFGNHPAAAAVLSAITALGLLSLHRQPFAGLQVEDQQLFLRLPAQQAGFRALTQGQVPELQLQEGSLPLKVLFLTLSTSTVLKPPKCPNIET